VVAQPLATISEAAALSLFGRFKAEELRRISDSQVGRDTWLSTWNQAYFTKDFDLPSDLLSVVVLSVDFKSLCPLASPFVALPLALPSVFTDSDWVLPSVYPPV
jgi:hypothetical protein